ncbi:putative Polyprotein [Cucumis melo var. makuwa]|uniref:Putative Polyprotein n=1 Tax=Cucumis melo var. makuwa TaxID=1194695 RepID=A0A5D3CT65_CUCMM|nr:putative Polyprotein [Cucumis melo var. makuwa]
MNVSLYIGYALNSKTYRYCDLENQVAIESNDINVFEDRLSIKSRNSWGWESSSLTLDRNPISTEETNPEPRRSKRTRTVKDFEDDFQTFNVEEDPKDLKEVLSSVDVNL